MSVREETSEHIQLIQYGYKIWKEKKKEEENLVKKFDFFISSFFDLLRWISIVAVGIQVYFSSIIDVFQLY